MERENVAFTPPLASPLKRIVANVLTTFLLLVWIGILMIIVGFFTRPLAINEFQSDEVAAAILLFGLISALGIQIYFMLKYQQTIAKKWLGIQVVDNTDYQPLSFGRYLARELIEWLLNFFFVIIPLINLILLLANKSRVRP